LPAELPDAVRRLEQAGVPSAAHDAKRLFEHAAGDPELFARYVERRAAREPLQHILGTAGFRYLDLAVGPGVFVPRPETELVAGAVIDAARLLAAPVVVDLCAGSGAIALSVAYEVPAATVHAVERDPAALEWLRRNASGFDVTVHEGDAGRALPELDGTVDVVVSNPPYVAEYELDLVEPEVRDHDPRIALTAGPDGLDVIRAVERTAWRLLKPGGLLVVEHSDRQRDAVTEILHSWSEVADHRDLTGRDRYATARKPA
jgi:release factor glutamine methyltransferase